MSKLEKVVREKLKEAEYRHIDWLDIQMNVSDDETSRDYAKKALEEITYLENILIEAGLKK